MKPMLAGKVEDIHKLKYPVICSPKIDGIRCLIVDGMPLSRKLKIIPNGYIQASMFGASPHLDGFDGELLIPGKTFNEVQSVVMCEDTTPVEFEYHVFDMWHKPELPYVARYLELQRRIPVGRMNNVKLVSSVVLDKPSELQEYETQCLEDGYEGLMVRTCDGRYKYGRSTTNEGYLLKLKRFEDSEAVVVGAVEEYHNGNAATVDELGHTKRSSHKANLQGKGCLGAFRVRRADGLEFSVGSGFTAEQRVLYWQGIDLLLGRTIVYKHQPHGSKEAPRFPVFKSFRHEDDISE